jgi:hypothetical protein
VEAIVESSDLNSASGRQRFGAPDTEDCSSHALVALTFFVPQKEEP